ncbi:MAG: light-harvesting antenna LH1, beta subunit [Hyphomicrobiaceae bacterium]|nr:light-harvesting antenna LH1, beta subunit [Hyphomicrobiaceae bacterium]
MADTPPCGIGTVTGEGPLEPEKTMANNSLDPNNLTDEQAREIHSGFMSQTIVFIAIAVAAHFLTWIWKPWLP